jgi:hypothetical protein
MVRKTRRNLTTRSRKIPNKKTNSSISITSIRKSFEHIEQFIENKINKGDTKESIVKALQKEWESVFLKHLSKKSAEEYVSRLMSERQNTRRKTRKHMRGGAVGALQGAPISGGETHPGAYIPQGITNAGNYVKYLDAGLWQPPLPGKSFDPINIAGTGQSAFPFPRVGMGYNQAGGKRKLRRSGRQNGGGSIHLGAVLTQAFNRPFVSEVPSSVGQDMQSKWYGTMLGPSPDQVQRALNYQVGSVYPQPIRMPS